jgi:hypothetical protein
MLPARPPPLLKRRAPPNGVPNGGFVHGDGSAVRPFKGCWLPLASSRYFSEAGLRLSGKLITWYARIRACVGGK